MSPVSADLSDPGPYGAGWVEISVPRPGGGTFDARLFYPSSGSGQGATYNGAGAPYPGISFGHGWITAVTRYQSTLEHLASWGYFVIASESYGGLFPDHSAFADDLRWCLTYLAAQNADAGSWLFQQVDTDAFGILGHSMGGGASLLAAERDSRIAVVANLAAAETNPSAIDAAGSVHVPLCLIAGDEDSIVPPSGHTIPMYDAAVAPRRLPLLLGGWHCGFLDSSFFGCDSGTLPRETQLSLTRGLLTEFFNLYLKDDQTLWRHVWGPELYAEPLIDNTRTDARISLDPQEPSLHGYGGQDVHFDVLLTNRGSLPASYTLLVEDNTWSTEVVPSETSALDPGASTLVTVTVNIAAGSGAAIDTALLSARSDIDGATRGYATLTTERRLLGDLNGDGVVDAADFVTFGVCLMGPDIAVADGCEGADLDLDMDADLLDFRIFQVPFAAP
jgi:dienelactone hydrolase